MAERTIDIPQPLIEAAAKQHILWEPTLEQREAAQLALPLVEAIALDYLAALKAIAALKEVGAKGIDKAFQDISLAETVSRLIAVQHRLIESKHGVYVVRFSSSTNYHRPASTDYISGTDFSSGLQIAEIVDTTLANSHYEGRRWEATGVVFSSLRDATQVKCLGGHSAGSMVDVLRIPGDLIELTDDKLESFAMVPNVIKACFREDEINQPGGIVQAMINQASLHSV